MIRVVTFVSALTALLCSIATDATAQMYIRPSIVTPATEIAVVTSGSGVFDLAGFGARVTVNQSDWFGTEASLDMTKAHAPSMRPSAFEPAHTILIVNSRVIVNPDHTGSSFWTLTAGGAVGIGVRRPLSPMVGVSFQHVLPDQRPSGATRVRDRDLFAVRLDVQCFPGGLIHPRTETRLMIGFAVLVH